MLTVDEIIARAETLPDEGDVLENLREYREEIAERFPTLEAYHEYLDSKNLGNLEQQLADVRAGKYHRVWKSQMKNQQQ